LNITFSPVELVVLFVAVSLGSTLQGALGYGLALVVSPILLMIDPRFIPAPLTIAAFILVILVTIRDRQALDFLGLKWALLGMIFGMMAGTYILDRFGGEHFPMIFSVFILLAVFVSAVGIRFPPRRSVLTLAGFFSGLMGILATIAGPPMALVYQDAPGKQLRATLSGFFIIGTILALFSLSTIGRFGLQEIVLAGVLIPGILVGFLLSKQVTPWVDRGYTRPAVLAIAAISAIIILVSQVW